MKIERIKSILLIILVISSIVLTVNKWFNEELWPDGYNLFSGAKNYLSPDSKADAEVFNPNEEVLKPAKIIVNTLNNHILLTKSSEIYKSLCAEIKDIIALAVESQDISQTDIAEWNNNLKSKSMYFSYPVMYDSAYFTSQLSHTYHGSTKYFKEFVIVNDHRVPSIVYVYAQDAETGKIEKIKINYENDRIGTLVNNLSGDTNDINYYSFELNFDTDNNNTVKDHVVIDPDVLINISGKHSNTISETNLFHNIASNNTLYSEILKQFKYNTSNIRKYIERDDSMVFVENYGTLTLNSNSLLSFRSVEKNKGIELNTSSLNSCLNSCITFVNEVTSIMDKNSAMYYEISSDIHDITGMDFTLTFDYYINDNIIIIPREKYSVKNAITVEVAGGKIVSYDQVFVSYTLSGEAVSCGSAIDAIDSLEGAYPDVVSDIFLAYKYDSSAKSWMPMWYIEDSKGNISMISSPSGGAVK